MVHDVQFGSKADQMIDGVRYANKRAEIWGLMRSALKYLCLPSNNQALREQLCGPEYSFSRTGDAILLEPKDAMKRRGLPSPDLADGLAITYGAEVATLPMLAPWVQPQGAVSEFDPFSDAAMRGEPYPEAKQRGGFTDLETGYQFRLRGRWDNDRDLTRQDWADAAASDAVSFAWREPSD
jgi:hypothetical protein